MKNKFLDKRAEEILTEDSLIVEIGNIVQPESALNNVEYHLATNIYQTVLSEKVGLDEKQRKNLGKEITRTITAYKQKRFILRIGSAAVFLLIIGFAVLIRMSKESDTALFARENIPVEFSGNTRLILSGRKEIKITSKESDIEYNGNGKAIKIDDTHEVRQAVGSDKLVMNTIIVPYGKRAHITFSDSSKVWLNSGTKLIYPARFADDKREVYLEGEGLFEISHNENRPFHVLAPDIEVKVLGTIFNITDYKNDKVISTVLEKGSVELKYKSKSIWGNSKVTMVPGMRAAYDPENKTIEQTRVNTKYYTSWKDGYLYFNHEPLENILKKISRYYDVMIRLNDQELRKETFSGPLDLRHSPSEVLDIIAEIIDMNIENINNQVILTRK